MIFLDRRAFLQHTSLAAMTAGLAGCATAQVETTTAAQQIADIKVRVHANDIPLVERTFHLLKTRMEERGAAKVVRVEAGEDITLDLDNQLPTEAFRIDETDAAVRIAGGSPLGLLYGVGKFLRTSRYAPEPFQPSPWRGVSIPQGTLRGMYFASHFHNWHHQASESEITRYLEDLALWGINAVMVIFPMINLRGWDDPEAGPAMDMVHRYARAAHGLGIQFVTGINNAMFTDVPDAIRAARLPDPLGRRGNSGHPICPSHPEGRAYLMETTRRLFEALQGVGLDVLCFWPYDEGGCACEKCLPWGSNGYLKLSRDQALLAREFFPEIKTILSTWMFDTPPEGEWQALSEILAKENDWLDYILADAHEDYPRYPLDVEVPGNLPLLNFPEISMWGNWPWGGYGANPLPARYQRLWDQVKQKVSGGLPYSEGIYEDLNKAVVMQFYWNRDCSARDALKEYIAYEFGAITEMEQVLTMIELLEQAASNAYQKLPVDQAGVLRAYELAESVHAQLPEWGRVNWRWELLHLRCILDRERFAGDGLETPAAEAALRRLIELYHCQMETDDPYHHRVRPRLRGVVSRNGDR